MTNSTFSVALLGSVFMLCASSLGAAQARQPRPPSALKPPSASQAFLQRAIMDDNAEIMFGRMAEKRGPAINDLGVMLVQDHLQARDRADQIAKTEGVAVPTRVSPASRAEQAKLSRLSGPQFNYAFVHFIIKDHRQAIASYRVEERNGGPIANLARSTLPSLRKHLRVALGLAQQGV